MKPISKNYPDPAQNVFTKLAYYWLTVDNYNTKSYDKAIRNGEKAVQLGGMEAKLEAGVYLILGSSYGRQPHSQDKALKWADKATDFRPETRHRRYRQAGQCPEERVERRPQQPAKPLTSLEKIGQLYTAKKYDEAIDMYNSFGASRQERRKDIRDLCPQLMKAGKLDAALKEFSDAYAKNRKAINAERLGNIYLAKAEKDKKFFDNAINYQIEAGLLYQKEKNSGRQAALLKNAKYWLYEKYNYNAKISKYNATVKPVKPAPSNDKEIKELQYEFDKLDRELQRKYVDIEMPGYEQDKLDAIQAQIDKLKNRRQRAGQRSQCRPGPGIEEGRGAHRGRIQDLDRAAKKKLGL